MTSIFIPVSKLVDCDSIEFEHYIPEDDKSIEAYDIRFTKGTGKNYEWIAEIDLPIPLAINVYLTLKNQLKEDGLI